MLYRQAPKTGDRLSILGFGCMRLPMKDQRIDEERAAAQLHHAIDLGVNYLDTAWPYHAGASEPFVGKALAGGYRDRVRLATKLPAWLVETRGDMDRYLDAQLEKLQTGRIDYYLLHNMIGTTWDRLNGIDVLDFVERAKADGRVVNAGFSFHGTLADFKRIVDAYPWEFCQIQFNYLDVEHQAGLEGLRYAAERDLAVIIMEPLRGGNLGLPEPPPAIDAIWKEADKPRTPVEWALRWIWNFPEVTVVLSGMNEESHIDQNLGIAEEAEPDSLTKSELDLVARAAAKYRELMAVGCTGCGYCLPCPEDVQISTCFEVYNKLHLFGNADESRFIYAIRNNGVLTNGTPGYASQCVQCGECLEKCPQELPIPDLLQDVVQQFEGPGFEELKTMTRQFLQSE